MKVTVKIENAYSDGHESKHEVVLDAPDDLGAFGEMFYPRLEQWFQDVVWPETGDGHGANNDLGSCFTATILAADSPLLLGRGYEWTD